MPIIATDSGRVSSENMPDIFGMLTVVDVAGRYRRQLVYECECSCGNIAYATKEQLKRIVSCGCYRAMNNKTISFKHGESGVTKEYLAWQNMKSRCRNKNRADFHLYGGRGIRVCDRWLNSFETFLSDVGRAPSTKHSIDRYPNNNGHYEPTNVRWATPIQQSNNKRNNKN